jgi:hypothetical protein
MKITAISPLNSATPQSIVDLISTLRSDLVVLPGFAENIPAAAAIQKVLHPGTKVFLESGKKQSVTPWLVSPTEIIGMPKQIYAQAPNAENLRQLESSFQGRTFKILHREVSFILCGEINAFNTDGLAKAEIQLPFDVLVNPAHSLMGRWHILGAKLRALSVGRTVVHVANNAKGSRSPTTDVRIYHDGAPVGVKERNDSAAWCTFQLSA